MMIHPELENPFAGEAYGWIQWKGTNVCMDVTCPKCGDSYHIDEEFAYYIHCVCGTYYAVSGFVRLIPVDVVPGNAIELGEEH